MAWIRQVQEAYAAAIKKSKDFINEQISKVRNEISIYPSYQDLPSVGDPNTWYYIPHEGSTTTFDIYVYENAQYVYKGTTQLNLDGYATDAELEQGLGGKVDKIEGKGLSTNDYTTTEKNKLADIESGANKTIVDAALSNNSENPVQNKVINSALTNKVDKVDGKGLSTEDFTSVLKDKLDHIESGANKTIVDSAFNLSSENPVQNKVVAGRFNAMQAEVDKIKEYGVPKYGVSGIGNSATTLTRIFDAVGATAQVGTDGSNTSIVNDFDRFAPWMWRKCVGEWSLQNSKPKFTIGAYLGDADYTEDGSMGDYVAVEIPLSFYYMDSDKLIVSAFKVNEQYKAFDIFCVDHNQNELLDKIYVPAYALAKNSNGYAVCLPNLDNWQGDYASNFNAARTYKNGALGVYASIMQAAYNFFLWAMYTVEFATLNCQSIMKGCSELRSADADKCTFIDATHVLLNNYNAGRVANEYVCISTATSHTAYQYQATHQIVSITRCNDQGVADSSGTYSLIEVLDLGKSYFTYDLTGETQYQFAARPWRTGMCNSVSTPSGSPVSNSSGYYPMKYRYIENVFGNQYHTSVDLFNILVQDEQSQNYLEWYYLPDPTDITTPANIANSTDGQAVLKSAPYVKLGVETPNSKYVSNYIKSKKYDPTYSDIWIPDVTGDGATSTTYFCDYASLVNSSLVRSARFGGLWAYSSSDGLSHLAALYYPAAAHASYGGDLWIVQTAG